MFTSLIFAVVMLLAFATAQIDFEERKSVGECTIPEDGMVIIEDTTFCPGTYNLPIGIAIGADNIILDCDGAVLDGNYNGNTGIQISGRNGVSIKNCNVRNYNMHGIDLRSSSNNNILNNTITNNKLDGIRLYVSHYNFVRGNNIFGNFQGIDLASSSYNTISQNNVDFNLDGFRLFRAHSNNISSNSITNSGTQSPYVGYGIEIWYSRFNQISNNIIESGDNGIIIFGSDTEPSENTISFNNISDNHLLGSFFGNGIALRCGSSNTDCTNSFEDKIEFNNIFNNSNFNFILDNRGGRSNINEKIKAEKNWWGTTNKKEIKEKIYDFFDDHSLGKVDFNPYLCSPYPELKLSPCKRWDK